jgi:hypothetical protein
MKPRRVVDPDDALTPAEAKRLRQSLNTKDTKRPQALCLRPPKSVANEVGG